MERRILLSFAHPDDESFLTAGTAWKYGAQGVSLGLVTATRGGAGKVGNPAVCTPEELPAVRESELARAAEILGIEHRRLLGYHDKELASAPPDTIRGELVQAVREFRPQIVMTFDPQGANRHSDHMAISGFTSDALGAAADGRWFPEAGEPHQVQRLLWTCPIPSWQVGREEELREKAGIDFWIDISSFWRRKMQALRAHRTQHLSIERYFLNQPDCRDLLSVETFRQAWGPPLGRRPLTDLFDGIE